MKKIILILGVLLTANLVNAQSINVDFGSTFDGTTFAGLFFADSTDTLYNSNGLITVGYFGNIGGQSDFASYLADFTQIGSETAFGAADNGYLSASASTFADVSGQTAYVLVLGGVTDFANAASATSYSIFGDSGWAALPAAGTPPAVANLLTLAPDNIVVGSFAASSTSGTLSGITTTAVPEPSTFAALAGLCALGAVMVRRRRA
jgi:hypothetical protein